MRQVVLISPSLIALSLMVARSLSACGGMSTDDYLKEIAPLAQQYNTARDVVDHAIKAVDSATTLREGLDAARKGTSVLENEIRVMNNAYRDLGNKDVPEKFHKHQQATLSAWRAGIEAATTLKLYLEKALASGQTDDTLVVAANRLFAEEDRYQLEARQALR